MVVADHAGAAGAGAAIRATAALDVFAGLDRYSRRGAAGLPGTGTIAAMGAAFADEPGLDMPPTPAAQLGFLDSLRSTTPAQFVQALAKLKQHAGLAPEPAVPNLVTPVAPMPAPVAASGLLLQDATLEDIVRWLHARNIEPTFRHRLP